ncbi:MAG: anthranilate phosphoribosyltransferase [Alphaproteobacteria bacterium]
MTDLRSFMEPLARGLELSDDEATAAFEAIMSGAATPSQIGAFLMALRQRGETVTEIAAAARVVRAKALTILAPPGAIDTCGTGGDGAGTFNISSAAALVIAACGVSVAKHGNRAVSSKCGSADVFAELGVDLDAPIETCERCLNELGITFLMAPRHHAAMRHVVAPRGELGIRTIFNLIGPLANPAGVECQVLGVFDRKWLRPLAEVLKSLGSRRAWVVHGADGLDELTTSGETFVAELKDGRIREFPVVPEDAGLKRTNSKQLQGGSPKKNAKAFRDMLGGRKGPFRDVVLLNAAAGLMVADKAPDLESGRKIAEDALESGAAKALLAAWVKLSRGG